MPERWCSAPEPSCAGCCMSAETTSAGGRMGEATTAGISRALERAGIRLARFKTGTPPRLDGRTIDYDQTQQQLGDDPPEPFSFLTDRLDIEQLPCWITYTTPAVHELIRANLHRAPMYSGQIQSTGPRYCPSLETKIVRFADRERHSLFLEPEGRHCDEVYVNGLSTSLPRDVQDAMFTAIAGLQRAEIVRYGYAIEYDYVPPDQLQRSLETQAGRRALFGRTGQRHHRLRRGRRPGAFGRGHAGSGLARPRAADPAPRPGLSGRDDRRSGHARRR